MDRRVFLAGLALATLVVSPGARAQPAPTVRRIGILSIGPTARLTGPEPASPDINAFVRALREMGYAYGQHFVTEARGSEGKPERYPRLVAELLQHHPDVIVAAGPALQALKQATSTIPVVMAAAADPIGMGIVRSLRQPGGNFTGLSLESVQLTGKRLDLIKEIVPGPAPVGVLWDQGNALYWHAARRIAERRGWKLLSLELKGPGDVDGAFKAATDARVGSLFVSADGILYPRAQEIADRALKARLPTIFGHRPYVAVGGLASYGADIVDIWRRAAPFVDKILKGARPGDLPIEQPTKFELIINLKTAKALGLEVPQSVLLQANELLR